MSNSIQETFVHCGSDCIQSGCPGHKIRLHFAHTSDTINLSIDGKDFIVGMDDFIFKAIYSLAKLEYEEQLDGS